MNQNEDRLTQITRNCREAEKESTMRCREVEEGSRENLIWGFRVLL